MDKYSLLLCFYYGSFLAFPYLCWVGWRTWRSRKFFSAGIIVLLLGICFIWGRFIEPQLVITKETTITGTGIKADILLLADIHLGIFKGANYLERVVDKANAIPADFNVIAGDFIYGADISQLSTLFRPLKKLNRPTYIVFGNHDTETLAIKKVLKAYGLIAIEHRIVDFGSFQLAGVGDRWEVDDKPIFDGTLQKKPLIIVAHNPDSVVEFDARQTNLVLSGHTHCGQVRIPYLYKKIIPSDEGHDCNLEYSEVSTGIIPVFITPGLGEVEIPMRLFNPPRMDLLRIR